MKYTFSLIGFSTREARLCRQATPFDNDRSPINRLTDGVEGFIKGQHENLVRPDIGRAKRQVDDQAQVARFLRPDAFSNPDQLRQFSAMIERRVPANVRAAHPDVFAAPLTQEDVDDLRATGTGRLATMQHVLSLLSGSSMPTNADPLASEIARAAMDSREDAPDRNSEIFGLYQRYMRSHRPALNEIDATSPENILGDPLAPPQLVSAIRLGAVDQQSLVEMYAIYRNRGTDTDLTMLEQRQQFGRMFGSVQEREYRQQTSSVMENFRNADPRLQWVVMGVGAFMLWKGLRSENGFVRAASIGLVGWWAYDRFVNGNENAIDNMGDKFKAATSFTGSRLRDAAEYVGLVGARQDRDKLQVMARFLDQHRLNVGPAAAGMASLAQVRLGTLADAFVPITGGVALGGALSFDSGDGRMATDSFDDVEAGGGSPGARRLYRELNDQANRMGLSRSEKEAMFEYQMTHREHIGKAVAHAFYLIASREPENAATIREIDEEMTSLNSFDDLPMHLKEKYNRMVIQGQRIAKIRYTNRSFSDIIASLAPANPSARRRPQENSTLNPNPETPDRREEFSLYNRLRTAPFDRDVRAELLQRGSEIELDYSEFIDNCEAARIITGDAKLALKRKFDELLNEGARNRESLPQVLLTVEKIKYAVYVASARSNEPLTPDMIASMTGPNSSTVMTVFNFVTRFLNQGPVGVPGSFHNVATLNHVDALLNRPFFGLIGGGVLRSMDNNRFRTLRARITTFQRTFEERRNVDRIAQQTLDRLESNDPGIFERFSPGNPTEGRTKARETMLALLRSPQYAQRLERTEQYVAQRMTNSLVRRMLVVEGPDGLARAQSRGERVITDNEQANIAADWDRLFTEIAGNNDEWTAGAWHRVEDIQTMFGTQLNGSTINVDTLNYADENQRRAAVTHAQELGLVFSLMILPMRMRPDVRDAIRTKVNTIRTRMETQRNVEMTEATATLRKRLQEIYSRHGTTTDSAQNVAVTGALLNHIQRTDSTILPIRGTNSAAGNAEINTALDGMGNQVTAIENRYKPQTDQLANIVVLLGANIPSEPIGSTRIDGNISTVAPPLTTQAPPLGTTAAPPLGTTAAPPLGTTAAPPLGTTGAPPLGTTAAPPLGTTAAPPLGTTAAPALSPAELSRRLGDIALAEIGPGIRGLVVRRAPTDASLPATHFDIAFPNRTSQEYVLRLTPVEMQTLSVAQIVQRWKENAISQLRPLLDSVADPVTAGLRPWQNVQLGAGDLVAYTPGLRIDGVRPGSTPFHIFIQHNPEEIARAYWDWVQNEANRKAFVDPFSVPGTIATGVRTRGLPGPAS